jgi:predicted nucleotidyltransferase
MQIRAVDNERILEIAKISFKIPVEIWAFGSRVKHTANEGSDLDLMIINKSENKNIKQYITIFKENLKNSNVPIFVQVFEDKYLPTNYLNEIKKHNQLYFKNN